MTSQNHQAIRIESIGDPEILSFRSLELPELPNDQIQIRVHAFGVNFADLLMRMGLYPDAPKMPFTPGYEVSGEIEKVGKNVKQFREGDRVLAITRFGGYATAVQIHPDLAHKIPDHASFEDAAAIPVNYLTAWVALFAMGGIQKGDWVFMHHILGGVGIAAAQLTKSIGGNVIGTTGSPSKIPLAQNLSIDHVFDLNQKSFSRECRRLTNGKGVHIILDATGSGHIEENFKALKPFGKMVLFGASEFVDGNKRSLGKTAWKFLTAPKINPYELISRNRGVFGLNMLKLFKHQDLIQEGIAFLHNNFENGTIKPVIAKVFEFDEISKAHQYIHDRKNIGKVVIKCPK